MFGTSTKSITVITKVYPRSEDTATLAPRFFTLAGRHIFTKHGSVFIMFQHTTNTDTTLLPTLNTIVSIKLFSIDQLVKLRYDCYGSCCV